MGFSPRISHRDSQHFSATRSADYFRFLHSHGRILPIPPAPAVLHQLMVDVCSVGQEYIGECASMLVLALGLEDDISSEDGR